MHTHRGRDPYVICTGLLGCEIGCSFHKAFAAAAAQPHRTKLGRPRRSLVNHRDLLTEFTHTRGRGGGDILMYHALWPRRSGLEHLRGEQQGFIQELTTRAHNMGSVYVYGIRICTCEGDSAWLATYCGARSSSSSDGADLSVNEMLLLAGIQATRPARGYLQ